jgi:hypothetical protein
MAHKRREEEERLYQASKMQKGGKSARTLGKPRPRANQMELHMQELTFFDKVAKAVKNKCVDLANCTKPSSSMVLVPLQLMQRNTCRVYLRATFN